MRIGGHGGFSTYLEIELDDGDLAVFSDGINGLGAGAVVDSVSSTVLDEPVTVQLLEYSLRTAAARGAPTTGTGRPLRPLDDGGPKIYRFRHASRETVTAAGHRLEEDIDPVAKISCRFRVWPRRW